MVILYNFLGSFFHECCTSQRFPLYSNQYIDIITSTSLCPLSLSFLRCLLERCVSAADRHQHDVTLAERRVENKYIHPAGCNFWFFSDTSNIFPLLRVVPQIFRLMCAIFLIFHSVFFSTFFFECVSVNIYCQSQFQCLNTLF